MNEGRRDWAKHKYLQPYINISNAAKQCNNQPNNIVRDVAHITTYLPIKARPSDLVEALFEHHLIVINAGKLEQYARRGLRQREAAFDIK